MNTGPGKQNQTAGSNYPGLGFAATVAGAWTRYLGAQTNIWNGLWSEMTAGTLTFGSVAQGSARLWQAYYDTVTDIVRAPFAPNTPQWLWFQYSRKIDNSLVAPVRLATVQDPSSALAWTALRSLDGTAALPESDVKVTWEDKLRPDALNVELERAAVKKLTDGQYLGFVYDRRAWAGAPLVVIALNIVP